MVAASLNECNMQLREKLCTYRDDLAHFGRVDQAVVVNVVHTECPFQFLARIIAGRDADREQEFLYGMTRVGRYAISISAPLEHMSFAVMSLTLNEMLPELSASKVRYTCSQK